jgi:hypothetical protein
MYGDVGSQHLPGYLRVRLPAVAVLAVLAERAERPHVSVLSCDPPGVSRAVTVSPWREYRTLPYLDPGTVEG